MASGFPGSIDNFTDPLTTSALNSPSHAGQHQDLNDAVEKIETYMGLVKVIPTSATNGTVAANGTVTVGNAVASVSVTCFSSLYDNYLIQISGGSSSAINATRLQLGATATGYYYGGAYCTYAGTLTATAGSNTTSWLVSTHAAGNGVFANIYVSMPFAATRTGFATNYISPITADGGANITGFLDNATSYTSFVFFPTSGTLTGGSIRVYGYRN